MAVFLWGFTGILGKLISLPTIQLVFLRMSIAMMVYFAVPKTRQILAQLKLRQWRDLAMIGSIICVHWLFFYQSIKENNSASLGMICLGTGPMFILWIEYFTVKGRKISALNFAISLIAIIGIYLVSLGQADEKNASKFGSYHWAIVYGIIATILAAVFTILNGKLSKTIDPLGISCVEMMSGALLLFCYHLFDSQLNFLTNLSIEDTIYISILSIFCTCIPFLLSIYALKKIEPFLITLTVNLEPIYGLAFAGIFWQEYKYFNIYFYLGSILILFSVFLPMISDRWKRHK